MMTKEDTKLISGFLSDSLSKEDKARFLKKISTDKAFIRKVIKEIELDEIIVEEYGLEDESDSD